MLTLKKQTEYEAALERDPYFRNRWHYFSRVQNIAVAMNPQSILEAGANGFPLFNGSTTADRCGDCDTRFDLTGDWPFEDDAFDLFIALQVWEHLNGRQAEAAAEMRRVCRRAILSFPFRWQNKNDTTHYNLDDDDFVRWVGVPDRAFTVGEQTKRRIYVFDGRSD